jgi:prevent-host-death family protein
MKHISSADANRSFSGVMRDVAQGETVVVTSHGRPVAKIEAVTEGDLRFDEQQREEARKRLWERLMSQPVLNMGKISRDEIYEDVI